MNQISNKLQHLKYCVLLSTRKTRRFGEDPAEDTEVMRALEHLSCEEAQGAGPIETREDREGISLMLFINDINKYLKVSCQEDGASLFAVVSKDRTSTETQQVSPQHEGELYAKGNRALEQLPREVVESPP